MKTLRIELRMSDGQWARLLRIHSEKSWRHLLKTSCQERIFRAWLENGGVSAAALVYGFRYPGERGHVRPKAPKKPRVRS